MSYYGDRALSSTVMFQFTTSVNGTPTTLSGSPVISVYKNSTTEGTTGVTLTADYDSRTGLNHVVIDTSADGTFFATGNDFSCVITTGTVGGVSQVGVEVGSFSIGRSSASAPTVAQIATAVWQDTTAGDFTTALSIGKSVMNGVSLGTGLTIARCTLTDTLTTYTGNTVQTGDAYARLGAPAGASASADIAAAKTDTAAIKAKTDNLPAAPASTTNITAGTITTVTNLTNAPTAGDLTSTMKTSVTTAATAATPTAAAVTGNVGGNVTGSVGSVVGLTASNLDATVSSRLASASYTSPPSAAAIAAAVWATTIETGYTALQLLRLYASILLSKISGAATVTNTFRDINDTKDRVTATVDSSGNRTSITLDAS